MHAGTSSPYSIFIRIVDALLATVGLTLNANGLPWTRLLTVIAERSIYIDNYPNIMLPHELRAGQSQSKGIGNLLLQEQVCLYYALTDSKNHPCRFKLYGAGSAKDRKGTFQVPACDYDVSFGLQI